jgi:putative membrane protein
VASPVNISLSLVNVFVAGMLAISAMMLPGLSGSFMLMLAGLYEPILNALKSFQLDIILSFMLGASIGILAFSHVLSFLFRRFPFQVYALLTGVMLGSLNRIWPWQVITQFRINSHGEQVPMLSQSVTPWHYAEVYAVEAHMAWALGFMIVGMLLVLIMSKLDGLLNSELKS